MEEIINDGKLVGEFVIRDTKDLQIFSVQQFMERLGYTLYRTDRNGLIFVSGVPHKTDKRVLSFNTAVRLHNSDWESTMGPVFRSMAKGVSFTADLYTVVMAISAKVINKAKVQYSNKKKVVLLGDERAKLVAFAQQGYAEIFLPIATTEDVPQ